MPAILPHRPGLPVPAGYHVESRAASGLVVAGALTLGVSYVVALGLALADDFDQGSGWLVVPVAGPWGGLGARSYDCNADTVPEANACLDRAYEETTAVALLAMDGVIQAVGVAFIVAGLASRTHELVRNDLGRLKVTVGGRPGKGLQLGLQGWF